MRKGLELFTSSLESDAVACAALDINVLQSSQTVSKEGKNPPPPKKECVDVDKSK